MREAVETIRAVGAIDAVEVGVLAARALSNDASGHVAAVFDRSLYIVVQGDAPILPGLRAEGDLPLARREREGPIAQRWEGEGDLVGGADARGQKTKGPHPALTRRPLPSPKRSRFGFAQAGLPRGEAILRAARTFEFQGRGVAGGQWICIGPVGLGAGPLNLRCALPPALDPWARGPRLGDPLRIGDGEIRLKGRWSIGFAGAPVWTPPPPGAWTLESLRAGLRALDRVVDARAPDQGLGRLIGPVGCAARLPPVAAAARAPLAALRRWVGLNGSPDWPGSVSELDRFRSSIGPLLGLGPGLTPSGDDALGGALVALHMVGREGRRKALWAALEPALVGATNAVSIAHLRAAAMGYGAAALHEAVAGLMAGPVDTLAARLDALGAIGHTSGWDALAGAAAALRGIAAEKERI